MFIHKCLLYLILALHFYNDKMTNEIKLMIKWNTNKLLYVYCISF